MGLIDKLLGNTSAQQIKKVMPLVKKINEWEPEIHGLSDAELRAKTADFRKRLAAGAKLDDLLPEAFAVVREAAIRTIGQRPYDVQLIGGIILHQGRIAEMRTGEGKTLVATLPSYLNALTGRGVYVVTVNEYLAQRDAAWMGKIHRFLGLTVGCIVSDMEQEAKKAAYECDITYGTNSEFGFDYLRDNMCVSREHLVQRELHYAIVDEVDSILIDEARTPLIISGPSGKSNEMYKRADRFVRTLTRGEDVKQVSKMDIQMGNVQQESGDYMCDIKARTVALTEQGMRKAEEYFDMEDISSADSTETNHYIKQALRAHALFEVDKDYIVADRQVFIVDAFTGRIMHGRRYSDGLHQALEAKEGVPINDENKTVATITYQNYFRMFEKLAGMTGTAKTEEDEFIGIYGLDVVEIPTNKPVKRVDYNDAMFAKEEDKFRRIVDDIAKIHETGQPLLVGTVSVEKSEKVSRMLDRRGIRHEVLNAKQHAKEADIVAQAGKFGAVTIATNMAGRGTDILLGGNPEYMAKREMRKAGYTDEMIENATSHVETDDEEIKAARDEYNRLYQDFRKETDAEHEKVVAAGGLFVIGTERHESRRIDNQLRGRSGRQGDPGATRFYVSLQDEMMRRFGEERMDRLAASMDKLMTRGSLESLEQGVFSKTIENTQKRVESYNFDIRKNVLKYDDVMNKMREIIYSQRRKVLMGEDVHDQVMGMRGEVIRQLLDFYCPEKQKQDEWNFAGLAHEFGETFSCQEAEKLLSRANSHRELEKLMTDIADKIYDAIAAALAEHEIDIHDFERNCLLFSVDTHWADHIDAMDQLREGIGLRAMGSQDPVIQYRNEGFDMFDQMTAEIRSETVKRLYHPRLRARQAMPRPQERQNLTTNQGGANVQTEKKKPKVVTKAPGPNDPCPCGSGKKYKKCCGRLPD
ncbi:MAG: preprotein translocase subunit SecA [Clostridia bacterium]|nr:preprotein translocase subunit SecA [Clostridia bacterium]